MRAMVYRGPYKIRVEDKDVPPIEHPNDAIVRVALAAICGSDLHLYHGLMLERGGDSVAGDGAGQLGAAGEPISEGAVEPSVAEPVPVRTVPPGEGG